VAVRVVRVAQEVSLVGFLCGEAVR
jgi:hypothetical protein